MEFRILGPVEAVDAGGEPVPLGGGKQLALLAVLLLNANRAVAVERLIDDLWGDEPPSTAVKAVQIYVSKLRKALPAGRLHTRPPGYLIELEPDELDLARCESLLSTARTGIAQGSPDAASEALEQALSLWRGPALTEFSEPFAQPEAARLEELRLACLEERIEADLALGRHDSLAGELEVLVARHPLRERLRAQQMLALYRSGRHADALSAYQDFRRLLDEQLGIEPSQRLRELERQVLQQAETLDAPSAQRPVREAPATVGPEAAADQPLPVPSPDAAPREAERRQLTVLSCGLADAEHLAGTLDPEELRAVVAAQHRLCTRAIEAFGGSIARIDGSRILAYFGYPQAHEDDPQRAVGAGLEIVDSARRSTPGNEAGRDVSVRVGIETGLVVVDDGPEGPQALGEAPTVAERLEQLAGPHELLVGPRTRSLTSAYFETEAHRDGSSERDGMLPHRVLARTAVSTRFEAAARHGLTPYTGRATELGTLASSFALAVAGRGRVVSVIGNPGMGKSRLLLELATKVAGNRADVLESRCRPFGSSGSDASYLPFVELLSRMFELAGADGPEELERRVVARVTAIDPALERYLPYYLQLLSIQSERYPTPPRFMGEEKRRAFEEALAALLTVQSRRRPLLLMLEDWHWADEASDSALRYLVGTIASFPILLVVAHRPEYRGDFDALSHHTAIVLQRLERPEVEALAAARLGGVVLPEGLGELISTRTDGNPLFIEEICSALAADGTLRVENGDATLTRPLDGVALPETVQAVIRSRLDGLDPGDQEVLRLASVIGREFGKDTLERLAADATLLDDSLSRLVAQDLVQQVSVLPHVEYAFKHVLVQIVVYETLLRQRRKELHALVGAAIEETFPDRLFQVSDSLAHHFELGEIWDKAATYRIQAGVRAFEHHAVGSALRSFARADELLAAHAPAMGWRDLYDLAFYRGSALGDRGRWPAAYESLTDAGQLADDHGPDALRAQTIFARANSAFWAHRFDDSLRLAGELEQLVGDEPKARLGVTSMQALTSFMCEQLPDSLERERELEALFAAVPDSPYVSRAAFVLGVFRRWRGDSHEAARYLAQAVEHDKEKASVGVYLQSLLHYCLALGDLGRYQRAIELLVEAREHGERADSLYGVLKIDNTLGWLYQEILNYPESLRYNELSLLSTNEARGTDTSTLSEIDAFARLNLGDLLLAMGETDRAREHFEATWAHVGDDQYVLARTRWKARCLLGLGDVALAGGDAERAELVLRDLDAHAFTDAFPFKKLQARALRLRAGVLRAHGEPEQAARLLNEALAQAQAVGNPTQVWKTQLALGDLHVSNGAQGLGRDWYSRAAGVLQGVAKQLDEPLRETLEQSRPMREVLAKARGER